MITRETGVLNPRHVSDRTIGDYWQKYLRDFKRETDGSDYAAGAEARRTASLVVAEAGKAIPPINYATTVPLAAYWADGYSRTLERAKYVYDLGSTVQKYSGQNIVWFRAGSFAAIENPRRWHDRIELDIARINGNGDAGVNHQAQTLTPEKQAATRHPGIEQMLYLARIGVVQSQRVIRQGGKLTVKEMHFGQNAIPAIIGRISTRPEREAYQRVRQETRTTLLFGNAETYNLLEMLTWSAAGDVAGNFADAAEADTIKPNEVLPELSFLVQARPKPLQVEVASVLGSIDDALAANQAVL